MERYLARIGFTGSRTPNLENLDRLVRCHLETVPFENLDFWHNPKELSLKREDLYDKVVLRRRGGVCCELNSIFCDLLTQLGYEAYPILVRILMRPGINPISHECVIVVVDGKKYYADVGFGGPGPKGLVCLDTSDAQTVYGEAFRADWNGVVCTISKDMDGSWVPLLELIDVPGNPMDFTVLLYYFTGHPDAHFVHQRTINLCLPDGYLALTGNTFSGLRGGEKFSREVPEEEIPQLLRREFGLEV